MRVKILLSTACRQRLFVKAGKEVDVEVVLAAPVSELSESERELLFALPQSGSSDIKRLTIFPASTYYSSEDFRSDVYPETVQDWSAMLSAFHTAKTARESKDRDRIAVEVDKAATLLEERIAAIREILHEIRPPLNNRGSENYPTGTISMPAGLNVSDLANWATYSTLLEQVTPLVEAAKAQQNARLQAEEERKQQIAETAKKEKSAWIAEHGSDYLKKAFEAGYDCQRRYVIERAALEFPGYACDFSDDARWKERPCPSEATLDEALRVKGTVVWLTDPGKDLRSAWELDLDEFYELDQFEPGEAVTVRFLDRYDLVKRF